MLLGMLWMGGAAATQSSSEHLRVTAIAESDSGGGLEPAERVASGDELIYTLEVRNIGATTIVAPVVVNPVPAHLVYVADSAVGPGAEISFSVDGGRTFDKAENLRVPGANGAMRAAVAADYTHIRWQLSGNLKANSIAFVRFRATVK
jgi:uncharacterized repeat protein (TIGR01451 family)